MICGSENNNKKIKEKDKNDLFNCIDNSHVIEFGWRIGYSKIKHTTIFIKVNENLFFIDYNYLRNKKNILDWLEYKFVYFFTGCQAVSPPCLECDCFLNENFSVQIKKCQRTLSIIYPAILKLSITKSTEKNRAKKLIEMLGEIQMGTYNVKKNSCRDFVKKAVEILAKQEECSQDGLSCFKNEMDKLEDRDQKIGSWYKC